MKRIIFCIFIFIIACSPKTEGDLFYDCQKKLNKMDCYSCKVEITSIGNKTPQKYLMKQWFKKPNKYKLEVISPKSLEGKITISDGNKAWIYHSKIQQIWCMEDFTMSEEQNMFVGYFIKNCIDSEKVEIKKEKMKNKDYLVISADIPGNHIYFHREKLWMNIEDMKPFLLQVFDASGKIRMEVKYYDFEYNPQLDEKIFQISRNIGKKF